MADLGLKRDLREIPKWVWIGAAGAGTLVFVLTRGRGVSSGSVANPATLPLATDPGTPVSGGTTSTPDYTGMLAQLQSEIAALQTGAGPASGPGPTQQPTSPWTSPQDFVPTQGPNPPRAGPSAGPNQGLLPTTSSPTPGGLSTAQQAIQSMLGVYGGPPVSTSNPYAGLGGGWDQVTQTTYAGGGVVENRGIAQPAPAPGQIVPPAVQTPSGAPAYQYAYGYQPGQPQQPGGSSLAAVLQQEIAAGAITRQQAAQSFANTPGSISGGGANPFA